MTLSFRSKGQRGLFRSIAFSALALISISSSAQLRGYIENDSYDTLCAEMDNINIPVVCPNATAYRIVAMNPRYYPTTIAAWSADWEDCSFGDRRIWIVGSDNSSYSEFASGGFSNADVYYAQDNPAAGIDEAASNMPREINNNWIYDQYIRFTADEVNDVNLEVAIGAKLTAKMAMISGTLEIKLWTQTTNGWVDQGNRVFASTNMTATWNIPDLTWSVGTDTNVIHLDVVRAGSGGQTTTNAWAYYDYLELRKRDEQGDNSGNPTVLFTNSNIRIETVWIDFWWRHPRAMKVSAVGGGTDTNAQYLRIKQRMPNTTDSWNEIFVLYEDGNARIIPFPPEGLGAVPYGASIILGPTTNSSRPFAGINEITVDPNDLSLDILYEEGGGAHVELRADRNAHVVDVSGLMCDTTNRALTRFRSMWVTDGKSDIDRAQSESGTFPISKNWSRLDGTWWAFFKEVASYHNTYCPEFRVEILGTNQGVLAREAESLDGGTNYTVASGRTNAYGGQTLAFGTNGGQAVYYVNLPSAAPDVYLHMRYSDLDGGDAIDHLGNTIAVIVDGVRTVQTYSVDTGGWDEFETGPSLSLGALSAGAHTLTVAVGAGTQGIELDWFDLVPEPVAAWGKKTLLTKQCEQWTTASNQVLSWRGSAVSGQTVHVDSPLNQTSFVSYAFSVATNYSHAYLRLRYADDVGPDQMRIYVDGGLRARFPTRDTCDGTWNQFTNAEPMFLGSLTAGTHTIQLAMTNTATWGVDLDEFEIYAYDNRSPAIGLTPVYLLPLGNSTTIVVNVTDSDGDTVALANPVAPNGSSFVPNTFTWTAGVDFACTTSLVTFVADDQRGLTNSIVTNSAWIVVPYDWDQDDMADAWEWTHFTNLTNPPTLDADADGADDYSEFIADTDPTNGFSAFAVRYDSAAAGEAVRRITIPTRPGRMYTIFFRDDMGSSPSAWTPFANTNLGVGVWIETNVASSTYTFVDDDTTNTSGSVASGDRRFYRVKVKKP